MSDDEKLKQLIPNIKEMLEDPDIYEFQPVLREILSGCETPDFNNISDVVEEFCNNDAEHIFRKLSEAAFVNAAMFGHSD